MSAVSGPTIFIRFLACLLRLLPVCTRIWWTSCCSFCPCLYAHLFCTSKWFCLLGYITVPRVNLFSEEHNPFIFRIEEWTCFNTGTIHSLKTEWMCSSETSLNIDGPERYILKYGTLHNHCYETVPIQATTRSLRPIQTQWTNSVLSPTVTLLVAGFPPQWPVFEPK